MPTQAEIIIGKTLPKIAEALHSVKDEDEFLKQASIKIQETMEDIMREYLSGPPTAARRKEAVDTLNIQHKTYIINQLCTEGMSEIAAQRLIKSCLSAIKDIVNTAVGFCFIP